MPQIVTLCSLYCHATSPTSRRAAVGVRKDLLHEGDFHPRSDLEAQSGTTNGGVLKKKKNTGNLGIILKMDGYIWSFPGK